MQSHRVDSGKKLRRADPSTIQDKFMVGYQGWFTCAGDGEPVGPGHHGWLHWFNCPIPEGGRPNMDLWPDVSEYSPSELYPAPGLKLESGEQAFLFSSRHPKTVQRHFHWMAQHGVDGVFLQRFAGQCDMERGNQGIRRIRDEVGDRVQDAAEKEGRVFAIMYDVSGVPEDRIQKVLEQDWVHLIRNKGVLDSPNYLKEKGRPVIALWGFGFEDSHHSPSTIRAITAFFRSVTPGGAYIMAGTPAHWRTSSNDADRNPEFVNVWLNEFDAISPWTIGRYGNEEEADRFAENNMKGDAELLRKRNEEGSSRKVDYIPVVLPGGSGYNLSEGKWAFNGIKRSGGRFLWKQIVNARRLGVRVMYGAMWDEYDEGTAFMPVVSKKRYLPKHDKFHFMALDEDGHDLPSDWYMRICGFAAEVLRSERMIHETFPSKELDDYWSSRPRYDAEQDRSQAESSGSGGESYQDWLAAQKEDKEGLPPPPYSLEVDEAQEVLAPSQTPPMQTAIAPRAQFPPSGPAPLPSPTTRPMSSSAISGPPPIDTSSRPRPQQHDPSMGFSASPHPSPAVGPATSSVSSLPDDFGRQRISTPQPVVPVSMSPPPQSFSPAIPMNTCPNNVSPTATVSQSQPQWPPPEWNVRPKPPQHPLRNSHLGQEQSRPGSAFCSKLSPPAPHTHHPPSPPTGPHSFIRPPAPSAHPPQQPSHNLPGTYPHMHEASYPFPDVSRPPYQPESSLPPFPSFPTQSPPLSTSYPQAHNSVPFAQPHSPTFEAPHMPTDMSGPQFPQAHPGQGGYYDGPPHHQSPSQYSYPAGPSSAPYFPHQGSSPGPAFPSIPGSSSSPMNPYGGGVSPQPAGYSHPYPQPSPAPQSSSALGGALDFAMNAVDRVTGRGRGRGRGNPLESVAQSGTRLFNKLTR